MKINVYLSKIDPSRYTVYQMLDYFLGKKVKLTQKKTENLYLFKTEPFMDILYNYAHILNNRITEKDISIIKKFFKDAQFRVKTLETKNNRKLLLASGFKFKDNGYIMETKEVAGRDYNYQLSKNIKILSANNLAVLKQAKLIFCEAFGCDLKEYRKKFGFFDRIVTDKNNPHVKTFVLYKNNQPVSTGTYYAFDKFSIENIGTVKSARGKGYARLIMDYLLGEARRMGYRRACLVASEAGLHVYKKVGFKILAKTNTYV